MAQSGDEGWVGKKRRWAEKGEGMALTRAAVVTEAATALSAMTRISCHENGFIVCNSFTSVAQARVWGHFFTPESLGRFSRFLYVTRTLECLSGDTIVLQFLGLYLSVRLRNSEARTTSQSRAHLHIAIPRSSFDDGTSKRKLLQPYSPVNSLCH